MFALIRETADSLDVRLSDMDGLEKESKTKKKKFVDHLYSNAIVDARCAVFKHLITIRNLRGLLSSPPTVLRSGRKIVKRKRKQPTIHRGNNEEAIARRKETERVEKEAKKEQIAADELILNAARAHLEDIKLVNQTGSALIPPSKQEHCRILYTKATEIQQRLLNVVHDEVSESFMLSNLQTSMMATQSRCRGVVDWKSAVAPEGLC